MGTSGIRDSSIPSRNVGSATVVQSAARIPGASFFIDAVTDKADSGDQACDHVFSSLRPELLCAYHRLGRMAKPALLNRHTDVAQVTERSLLRRRLACGVIPLRWRMHPSARERVHTSIFAPTPPPD